MNQKEKLAACSKIPLCKNKNGCLVCIVNNIAYTSCACCPLLVNDTTNKDFNKSEVIKNE